MIRLKLFILLFAVSIYSMAQSNTCEPMLSSYKRMHSLHNDSIRAYMLDVVYGELTNLPYECAQAEVKRIINFCRQKKLTNALIYAYINAGSIYTERSPLEAYKMFQEAISIAKDTDDKSALLHSHHRMSLFQKEMGIYEESMKHMLLAKDLAIALNDTISYYDGLLNEMDLYLALQNHNEALKKGYELLSLTQHLDYDMEYRHSYKRTMQLYNSLGIIDRNLEQYDSALKYFKLSREIALKINDEFWAALAAGNMGSVYWRTKQYDKSVPLMRKDVTTSWKYKQWQSAINAAAILCDIYLNTGNLKLAETYHDSIAYFVDNDNKILPASYWNILSQLEALKGNFTKALEAQKRYADERVAALDRSKLQKIERIQRAYDLEKKQRDIEKLTLESAIRENKVKSQRIVLAVSWTALILAITLTLVIIRGYRRQKFTLKIVQEHRAELLTINSQLMAANQELSITKEKLQQNEQTLRTTILKSPVATCLVLGPDHRVEIVNEMMLSLWAKTEQAVLNKPLAEVVEVTSPPDTIELLSQVYKSGIPFKASEQEIELIRNGKKELFYLNFVYEPYYYEKTTHGVLIISTDVTDQVLARQKIENLVNERTIELQQTNAKLQKSNEELLQFAYISSHDLMEPIRKIRLFVHRLQEWLHGSIDSQSEIYLNKISNSAARMQNLIRDVLTYSELNGRHEAFEFVNLNETINQVKTNYDVRIEQQNVSISSSDLPTIEAIPGQMERLFGNLVSNSLKFCRKSEMCLITITSSILSQEEKKKFNLHSEADYARIVMKDNGIGFRSEYAEQIFGIFKRLHLKSEYEGTGIGLAMCRKIVQTHNGIIDAIGSSEDGAVFNIYLPLRRITISV